MDDSENENKLPDVRTHTGSKKYELSEVLLYTKLKQLMDDGSLAQSTFLRKVLQKCNPLGEMARLWQEKQQCDVKLLVQGKCYSTTQYVHFLSQVEKWPCTIVIPPERLS